MTVCLDTNVLIQMFGGRAQWRPLRDALFLGRLEWAISTSILMEYQEIVSERMGARRWQQVAAFVDFLAEVRGTVRHVEPSFQFRVIVHDADDNKFTDCAIAAQADFVITDDGHFAPLEDAGYRPKPISPVEFLRRHLH